MRLVNTTHGSCQRHRTHTHRKGADTRSVCMYTELHAVHHARPLSLPSLFQKLACGTAAALLSLTPLPGQAFGPVSVKLMDVNVTEVPCKKGTALVTGGNNFGAACLKVTATAENPGKQPLFNADVFGRVFDANGEPALDAAENIRIAYIETIPPGKSEIAFSLTIAAEQANQGPVKVVGLKATGFPGKMLPGQGSGALDACDPDLLELGECDEDAAAIR